MSPIGPFRLTLLSGRFSLKTTGQGFSLTELEGLLVIGDAHPVSGGVAAMVVH
jgi:hypothetical protein